MIDKLSVLFAEKSQQFEQWFAQETQNKRLPFYSSADIRDSGHKASCIDFNLFPAGFNNLCKTFTALASVPVRKYLDDYFVDGHGSKRNVLIVPEAHSRNPFYNQNLQSLKQTLENAGLIVTIAAMAEGDEPLPNELVTFDNQILPLSAVRREGDLIVGENNEDFDWLLLNNDLSSGSIDWLENLDQPIIPPLCFGWQKRSKFTFFKHYNTVVEKLSQEIDFDPWHLSANTTQLEEVNFVTDEGRTRVADEVDKMLTNVGQKYQEYKIDAKPHVFIKNDTGTYGMGIMVVDSADQIINMNRKARNKMALGKGRRPIKNVVIQEAVPTRSMTDEYTAEPVVYMVGSSVIGTFLRANTKRGAVDNLNSRGMEFYNYCELNSVEKNKKCACDNTLQKFYRTISRLSVLAATLEMEEVCPKSEMA